MVEPPKNSFSRLFWKYLPWFLLLLIVLVIIFLYFAVAAKKEEVKTLSRQAKVDRPAVNVVTQVVEPTTLQDKLNLPATIQAWEDLMLKAEVRGRIVALHAEEGDRVMQGDRIAEIDKRDYRNNLEAIRAQYELARINYERLQKLFGAQAVPKAKLDEAKYRLDELKASLSLAQVNLERCDITAPMKGVVDDIPVSVGDIVAFGDPVAQLLKIDPLKVEVAIPEVDAPLVREIGGCTITIPALAGKSFSLKKIFFSSQPRRPAMVYILRLRLDNTGGKILPGMFARAEIVKQTIADSLAVPLYAVIARDDEKFVYTVKDGTVQKNTVTTGILEDWKVRIISGLSPGDEVIIAGHRGVDAGQQVKVVKTVREPSRIMENRGDLSAAGPVPEGAGLSQR